VTSEGPTRAAAPRLSKTPAKTADGRMVKRDTRLKRVTGVSDRDKRMVGDAKSQFQEEEEKRQNQKAANIVCTAQDFV